jgi:hypothetical protein
VNAGKHPLKMLAGEAMQDLMWYDNEPGSLAKIEKPESH